MALFNENAIEAGNAQNAQREAQAAQMKEAAATTDRLININVSIGPKRQKQGEADAVAEQHKLYTKDGMMGRRYYTDYQQKNETMRATETKISTRLDDRQTVGMMLDLAQSKGWQTVKLRGTDDFRREAWVQAQERGLATEGYKAKETDKQELARRVADKPTQSAAQKAPSEKPAPRAAQAAQKIAEKPAETKAKRAVWGEVEKIGRRVRAEQKAAQSQTLGQGQGEKPKSESVTAA